MHILYICSLVPLLQLGFSVLGEETDLNSLLAYEDVQDDKSEFQDEYNENVVVYDSLSKQSLQEICKDVTKLVYIIQEDITISCTDIKDGGKARTVIKRSADEEQEGSGDGSDLITPTKSEEANETKVEDAPKTDETTKTDSQPEPSNNENSESSNVEHKTEETPHTEEDVPHKTEETPQDDYIDEAKVPQNENSLDFQPEASSENSEHIAVQTSQPSDVNNSQTDDIISVSSLQQEENSEQTVGETQVNKTDEKISQTNPPDEVDGAKDQPSIIEPSVEGNKDPVTEAVQDSTPNSIEKNNENDSISQEENKANQEVLPNSSENVEKKEEKIPDLSDKHDAKKDAEFTIQGKTLLGGKNHEEMHHPSMHNETLKTAGSTETAQSGSKDTTILIVLLAAVVIVGALAFGYNFIKKRKQQSADLERVERGNNRTPQNLNKSDNLPESKPLMNDKKEVEMVEMKNGDSVTKDVQKTDTNNVL